MDKSMKTDSNNIRNLNLLKLITTVISYLRLIYALFLYILKSLLIHLLVLLNKLFSIKAKKRIKKILFYNATILKCAIFFGKWVKTHTSVNQIRLINNIVYSFMSVVFISLFSMIVKKRKWNILIIEKLKNNLKLIEEFEKIIANTNTSIQKSCASKVDMEDLTKIQIEIYDTLQQALFLKKINTL